MAHEHPSPDEQLTAALDLLRAHGHRITTSRKAILSILTHEHGPFTAEQLHSRLDAGECDLVTVYRTLTSMEEIQVVRRCDFGDGTYRYEINHPDHHHHHLICRSCRVVTVIDVCVVDALERMARDRGYTEITHTLELFGLCPACTARDA